MIRGLLCLAAIFLTDPHLGAAESIALGEVPCTDAAWFWTHDGHQQPVIDRNLQGHALSIGGRQYQHGISGHTGFSAVYNLSGLASSFTCLAGIDDEEHPKDPVEVGAAADLDIVVLVDRRERLRRKVRLGEAAIPIAIELTGAQQLELRGEYGKAGFTRQRVDFVDPQLVVDGRERFLAAAAGWRDRVAAERDRRVAYPDPPAWKDVAIRRVAYRGLANAYRITTRHLELIVTPEHGGMISSLSLPGGRNLISENYDPARVDLARGRAPDGGGHFNRHQPNRLFNPPDPILLYGNSTIEFPAEGRIVMRSPESCYLFLRQGYEIAIAADGHGLQVRNIQTNTAPFAQDCGIWSITRIDTAAATAVRIPGEIPDPPLPSVFEPRDLLGMVQAAPGWDELPISPELRRLLEVRSLEWRRFARQHAIAARFGDTTFTTSIAAGGSSRDLHPIHLYLSKRFIELELHGETRSVEPGGSVELTETWNLSN